MRESTTPVSQLWHSFQLHKTSMLIAIINNADLWWPPSSDKRRQRSEAPAESLGRQPPGSVAEKSLHSNSCESSPALNLDKLAGSFAFPSPVQLSDSAVECLAESESSRSLETRSACAQST